MKLIYLISRVYFKYLKYSPKLDILEDDTIEAPIPEACSSRPNESIFPTILSKMGD